MQSRKLALKNEANQKKMNTLRINADKRNALNKHLKKILIPKMSSFTQLMLFQTYCKRHHGTQKEML